jgi:hypothetical protein
MSEEEKRRCIVLGICQATEQEREVALAESLDAFRGLGSNKDDEKTSIGRTVAEYILENFDLVPKGVGVALVDGYRAEFASGVKEE